MNFTRLIVFLSLVACVLGSWLFPLDRRQLRMKCGEINGKTEGIYLPQEQCASKNLEAFTSSLGKIVCCRNPTKEKPVILSSRKESGQKSKDYCLKHVPSHPKYIFNINGGIDSGVKEFPHMVALAYNNKNTGETEFNCGGSLISEKFVITAAHCVKSRKNPAIFVRLGRTNLNLLERVGDNGKEEDISIKKLKFGPNYNSQMKYNDIALIELEKAVTFKDNIKPICLDTGDNYGGINNSSDAKRLLTAIGFGMVDYNSRNKSDWLLKASLDEESFSECKEAYNYLKNSSSLPKGVITSQICARNDDADTCAGDSGSPLQIASKVFDKYFLVGITSAGHPGCGPSGLPGLYTRVSSFIDWIEDIVWPDMP